MKQLVLLLSIALFACSGFSQRLISPAVGKYRVSDADLIRIVKAEDARDAAAVNAMLADPNPAVRYRAALAAGRIGAENSLSGLIKLLGDDAPEVARMAAFAIGEVESVKGADAIISVLKDVKVWAPELARAVEAAGKIAAANPKDPSTKILGSAILECLRAQLAIQPKRDEEVSRLGLTAALRARPEGADVVVARFLSDPSPRIRSDALNTMSRLRAKNADVELRRLLTGDSDAAVRANAARALGAADDKGSVDLLIKAATTDNDSRVRVSAIRSLAALKDQQASTPLLEYGEKLLGEITAQKKPAFLPPAINEFTEVATAIGRLLANTDNERADKLFADFGKIDQGATAEVYIARVRVGQRRGSSKTAVTPVNWRQFSTIAQTVGEFADIEPTSETGKAMKKEAPSVIRPLAAAFVDADPAKEGRRMMAGPDALQAYAKFKTEDLGELARKALLNNDVIMRATAAGVLADLPASPENIEALKKAFEAALITDKHDDDAQLAALDALYKLDKNSAAGTLLLALNAPDYLVRKKAFDMLSDADLQKTHPGITTSLENARSKHKDQVLPYSAGSGTKLGQILSTDADYRRALSRKNGSIKAVVVTEKGTFTIVFNPEEAPLTVDNWVRLARQGYFNGLEVHRVVPNFVMQDGDPRGDGNGGPGWSIRCEINMLPYDRGAVGMALSGKDTGGSQWFVTHSPQPHLDGGYTVFGHVSETDMKVVDNIVRGDKILSVRIIGR